jgi:hypothetical protein
MEQQSEQYRKAIEAAGLQINQIRADLAAERTARERASEELTVARAEHSRDLDEMKRLGSFYEKFKKERSTQFAGMYDREISPYFEELRKKAGEIDPAIGERVTSFGGTLQASLTSGVTDPQDENQLLILRACASVQRHTSSELEKALKTEREWAQKYETLLQKLSDQEARAKEHETRAKELELQARAPDPLFSKSASHFASPVVVDAVAGRGVDRDFTSLFSLSGSPTDWRSRFAP